LLSPLIYINKLLLLLRYALLPNLIDQSYNHCLLAGYILENHGRLCWFDNIIITDNNKHSIIDIFSTYITDETKDTHHR